MFLYLFEYDEGKPFTEIMYYLHPSHYKYETTSDGRFYFRVYGRDIPHIVIGGLYSVITEEELKLDDAMKYRYFILPRVKIEPVEDGALLETLTFSSTGLQVWGIEIARGVEVLSNRKYSIHNKEFPQLA